MGNKRTKWPVLLPRCILLCHEMKLRDNFKAKRTKRATVRSTGNNSRSILSKVLDSMFLPGILDDITMGHIVPKLSWKDTYALSSVSRTWLQEIRSGRVHAGRDCYRSTDTLIVVPYFRSEGFVARKESFCAISIVLYSMKEDRCYELPPLPPFPTPFTGTYWYRSVSLDGKVYVMQVHTLADTGEFPTGEPPTGSSRMLAFDVAGQVGWQQCANMQITERRHFGCGVLDGKIYVFGGTDDAHIGTSEVYNPKDNTWSFIKPLNSGRCGHQVALLGDKFVMHGGLVGPRFGDPFWHHEIYHNLEVYNPIRDEWTTVELFIRGVYGWGLCGLDFTEGIMLPKDLYPVQNMQPKIMFTAHGKIYSMDGSSIYVYDFEKRSWEYLHASSFTEIEMGPVDSFRVVPMEVLAVGEELLAIVTVEQEREFEKVKLLLRSRGRVGGGNKEIVWRRARIDVPISPGLVGWASREPWPGTYISALHI